MNTLAYSGQRSAIKYQQLPEQYGSPYLADPVDSKSAPGIADQM